MRFQDAVKLARVKSVDLVKIDIEGMEFEVLNSLSDENW
nr:FkbM family methyltransferase [bacterium]